MPDPAAATPSTLGEKIDAVRLRLVREQRLGASLDDVGALVAEREGVTPYRKSTVSRWIRDERAPRRSALAAIASLAGMTPAAFAEWEPHAESRADELAPQGVVRSPLPRAEYSARLNAWLHRFLAELADIGATTEELRGAELALTNDGIAQFFAVHSQGVDTQTPEAGDQRQIKDAADGSDRRETRRGIPEEDIISLWDDLGAVLKCRVASRHR